MVRGIREAITGSAEPVAPVPAYESAEIRALAGVRADGSAKGGARGEGGQHGGDRPGDPPDAPEPARRGPAPRRRRARGRALPAPPSAGPRRLRSGMGGVRPTAGQTCLHAGGAGHSVPGGLEEKMKGVRVSTVDVRAQWCILHGGCRQRRRGPRQRRRRPRQRWRRPRRQWRGPQQRRRRFPEQRWRRARQRWRIAPNNDGDALPNAGDALDNRSRRARQRWRDPRQRWQGPRQRWRSPPPTTMARTLGNDGDPKQPSTIDGPPTPSLLTMAGPPPNNDGDALDPNLEVPSPVLNDGGTLQTTMATPSFSTTAGPSPTKARPSPTKATPSPTKATPSPTKATPSPTKATPSPTKATGLTPHAPHRA